MPDDWTEVLTITDASGKTVTVGHASGYVRVAVRAAGGVVLTAIVLDGERRDEFIRAWAMACWHAEAVSAP